MKMELGNYQQIEQSVAEIEVDLQLVGSEPVGIKCPHCQEDVMSRAIYKNSRITHIVAVILGIFFWWMCCCFLPYFTKRWKNVEHICSSCGRFVGVYIRKTII